MRSGAWLASLAVMLVLWDGGGVHADGGVTVQDYAGGKRATLGGNGGTGADQVAEPSWDGRPDARSPADGGDPARRFEPGEVLVMDPPRGFSGAVRRLGFRVLGSTRLGNLGITVVRLRVPGGVSVPDAVKGLAAHFPGITVDANHVFDSSGAPAKRLHARAVLGWPEAPANCGAGTRIGMIDAPVDLDHPALKGQKVTYRSFHKPGRKPAEAEHGTAVAGMIAGRPEWGGLLPGAELLAANMFEINERGAKVGNAKALLSALDWLAGEKVEVINLSVAGADNKVLRYVFDKARGMGLVMVAAAGNWGRDDKPAFPAAYPHVVAVTAVDDHRILYRHANEGLYIEFAAPGVDIWTPVPGGGRYQSGTSFATPYVSAVVALAMQRGVPHEVDAVRGILRKFVLDLGVEGRDKAFGWGFLNIRPPCAAD